MNDIAIQAKDIKLVRLADIQLNPKNRNKHSKEQIDRLCEIIKYQGFRNPVTISNRTNQLVAGEGRYLAVKQLNGTYIPAIFQDFDNEEQEYSYGVSDNAIASWAELDLSGINTDLGDLGPDFNIDWLGIKSFLLEPADKFINKEIDQTQLWDEKWEGPQADFRVIVTVKQQEYIKEVLRLLNIETKTEYAEGKVVSVRWPQIENV